MPENPNIKPDQTPVNLDEIDPETAADGDGGEDEPNCPDSPTGEHEFDTNEDDEDTETCVYCGEAKD